MVASIAMGDEADRIIINVGGVPFETYISTLQNIPDTRLAWLTEGLDPDPKYRKEIFFDRHSAVFVHILNYYRTGKLHTPTDICGPLFEEELNFWGIDEKQMEPCCWESFTKHREAEVNLKSFEGPGFEDLKSIKQRKFSSFNSQDGMTCRERMDQIWYMMDRPHSSNFAKYTSILSCFMIVLSVTVYCLNTLPQLKTNSSWKKARYAVDFLCMCWFTLEFTIRLMVCPDRFSFVQSVMNWIDFLSVIPSYLILFFIKDQWLIHLVIIRLLRLFRFFKLSYGLQVLLHTLKASFYELILLLLILLIPIVIFSSLVHTVEMNLEGGSEKFISIPATFWWCLITMTSVGYGDMVPATWAGKIVGSVCAICGVLIVALPISVIGSNFSLYYAHVRARLKLPCKDRKILAGNLRGLLKQPLSLSSRERDRRGVKWTNTSALRRKGASRKNCPTSQGIQLGNSFSSLEEKEDRRSSSDACLDWDSTMDSQIKFNKKEASKKRTSQGSRRQAIGMLFPASDSEKSTEEIQTIPFPRARRGAQTTLSIVEDRETCSEASEEECVEEQGNSDVEERNGEKSWRGDENAFEDQINKNDTQSLDFENISRHSSIRGSDSQAASSRRNSMRLMNLSVIPPHSHESDIVIELRGRKRRETVTSNDEPTITYQKKKRTKVKKPKKSSTSSYTKMKNSMPVPTRKRRGCVLTLNDDRLHNERTENGYLSDSSGRISCSPNEPRGSYCSSASTPAGECRPLIDAQNMNHNSIESPADISLKLISRLKQIDNDKTSCNHRSDADHGKTIDFPGRTDTRLDSSGQVIPNSFAKQMILRDDLNNKILVDKKSYAMCQGIPNRKQSRSEFDLRTKIEPTYVVVRTDRHPYMREVSSDIDLRLLESGV